MIETRKFTSADERFLAAMGVSTKERPSPVSQSAESLVIQLRTSESLNRALGESYDRLDAECAAAHCTVKLLLVERDEARQEVMVWTDRCQMARQANFPWKVIAGCMAGLWLLMFGKVLKIW